MTTKAIVADAFDAAAADYETVGPEFFDRFGRALVEHARIEPGMRVMDVGVGSGAALLPAATRVGPTGHVLGIDIAAGMVDRARHAARAQSWQHVDVHVGDAEDPPGGAGEWDRILAAQVLFFLPSPELALAAYHRLLRLGGMLAFSTWGPNDPRWAPVYAALFGGIPADAMPKLTPSGELFAADEPITALLKSAGFGAVTHEMISYDIVYSGPDEWLAWSRSHGARAYWDAIPPERLPTARDNALDVLRELAEPDGTLHMATSVRYTTAKK